MTEFRANGFGAVLRQRREELGLSLNDVAASTRVRKTYLQALEEENLQMLPGVAYAVGFLRIYARQLGLPVEPLLTALSGDAALDGQDALPGFSGDFSRGGKKSRRKRRPGSSLLLPVGLLLLLLAAAAGYFYFRTRVQAPPAKPAAAVSAAPAMPVPAPPAQKTASPPPAPAPPAPQGQAATPPAELAVLPAGGAVVRMLPVGAGTMKVSLDGQEVREYQLQSDHSLNWKVSASLAVELSAPGLVKVWVDQQELAVAEHSAFTLTALPRQERRP